MALLTAFRERLGAMELGRRLMQVEGDRRDLLAAAATLVVCARELLLDVEELDAGDLRARLGEVATSNATGGDDEDGAVQRLVRAVDRYRLDLLEHADRGRRYLRDREGELLRIIEVLREGLANLGGDGHVNELDAATGRLESLGRLDDLRTVRAELNREVGRLRTLSKEKRERDTQRLRVLENEVVSLRGDVDEARRIASTDALTGAANRAVFDESLGRLIDRGNAGSGGGFALLFIDVDHFKSINDRHGHLVGDRVLRGLVEVLRAGVRRDDVVARYGGEEFAVLLPTANVRVGMRSAEKLRRAVEDKTWTADGSSVLRFTVSVGVAAHAAGDTVETLVGRADAALYRAKQEGRNRSVRG